MAGRAGFEKRAAPELARVMEAGERVVASGYAQVQPGWAAFAVAGAMATLGIKHFWVVATDRRLVLLRLIKVGTAMEVHRAEPFAAVKVLENRKGLIDRRLTIQIGEDDYPLQFALMWRKDAEAIAAALGA